MLLVATLSVEVGRRERVLGVLRKAGVEYGDHQILHVGEGQFLLKQYNR